MYVLPDDVLQMAIPVLTHRLVLNQEAKFRKKTEADIMQQIISEIKIPR
jgi:MoxR-like ATPase